MQAPAVLLYAASLCSDAVHAKGDAMGQNTALRRMLVRLLLLLLLPTAAMAERRTALVIGNAVYETGPLRNPLNDATDIAAALRQLGFMEQLILAMKIVSITPPNRRNVIQDAH
jgi:hypothetical protein